MTFKQNFSFGVRRMGARVTVCLAVLTTAVSAAAADEGLEEPMPSLSQLQEFLEQFGRHLESQDGELERHLHEFSRQWEQEQDRFLRETEEIREHAEQALVEFMERSQNYIEENEVAAQERLRAMRESADALGSQWMERLHEWERRLDQTHPEPGTDPHDAVEAHVIPVEHRSARELAGELQGLVAPGNLHALNDHALVLQGDPAQLDFVKDAVRQLDRPEASGVNLLATIYVVAVGGAWESPRPLPERLASLQEEMGAWGGNVQPVLLDMIKCRTRLDEGIEISSNLPDAPTQIAQGYHLQIRQVVSGRDGVLRLDGVRFTANLTVDNAQRPVHIEVSPDVQAGQPTLLGSGSVRGAEQAILLVAELTPVL